MRFRDDDGLMEYRGIVYVLPDLKEPTPYALYVPWGDDGHSIVSLWDWRIDKRASVYLWLSLLAEALSQGSLPRSVRLSLESYSLAYGPSWGKRGCDESPARFQHTPNLSQPEPMDVFWKVREDRYGINKVEGSVTERRVPSWFYLPKGATWVSLKRAINTLLADIHAEKSFWANVAQKEPKNPAPTASEIENRGVRSKRHFRCVLVEPERVAEVFFRTLRCVESLLNGKRRQLGKAMPTDKWVRSHKEAHKLVIGERPQLSHRWILA